MDLPGTSLSLTESNYEDLNKASFKIDEQLDREVCKICKMKFTKYFNLRIHMKRKHPGQVDLVFKKARIGSHVCKECGATFIRLSGLNQHIKKKHLGNIGDGEIILKPLKQIKCALCDMNANKADLMLHYNRHHEIVLNNQYLEFDSFHNFQLWKETVEKDTFSSFINKHGIRKTANSKKITYECHRSGEYATRGKNIRSLKHQGSNKINGFCPAEMDVVLNDTKCSVQFCNTHIGHQQDRDLGHLFLPKTDRENIAAKISAQIPFRTILDEIRDSISNCHLERIHLLTKQDLYNIERSFNLNNSCVRHKNDAISVDAWVNELKESESVLYYKSQDSHSEYPGVKDEDFILIIMTPG